MNVNERNIEKIKNPDKNTEQPFCIKCCLPMFIEKAKRDNSNT